MSLEKNVSYYKVGVNKENLIALNDFPSYYIDKETASVYHLDSRKQYRKLSPAKRNPKYIFLNKNHVCIPKLLYAALHNIPYFDISKDDYVFEFLKNRKCETKVLSRSEIKVRSDRRRADNCHNNRLDNLARAIKELRLLRRAYLGDAIPLLKYVHENKEKFLLAIAELSHSKERAKIAFELAYDVLLEKIDYTSCNIYNFSEWFVKTAYSQYLSYIMKKKKFLDVENIPSLSDKKIQYKKDLYH